MNFMKWWRKSGLRLLQHTVWTLERSIQLFTPSRKDWRLNTTHKEREGRMGEEDKRINAHKGRRNEYEVCSVLILHPFLSFLLPSVCLLPHSSTTRTLLPCFDLPPTVCVPAANQHSANKSKCPLVQSELLLSVCLSVINKGQLWSFLTQEEKRETNRKRTQGTNVEKERI